MIDVAGHVGSIILICRPEGVSASAMSEILIAPLKSQIQISSHLQCMRVESEELKLFIYI